MPEECISISTDSLTEERPLPDQARVSHTVVLALCILAVTGSLLLRHGGDGLYLFGVKWSVSCVLYHNFGIKCALCGLTRSFSSIGGGDFSVAMRFHILGPAVFAFVCLQMVYRIYMLQTAKRQNKMLRRAGIYSALVLAGALLINWFVYLGGLVL